MKSLIIHRDLSIKVILTFLLILCPTFSFAQEQVASIAFISFARGGSSASQIGLTPRLLGKGSEIYSNDNIQTSSRSFVIISFNDGSKITVRPSSSFSVTEYTNTHTKKHAKLTLYKGGIRASSGEIAQLNPDNYQIKTPYATIKAQQADYSVRVCQNDCDQEVKQHKSQDIKKTQNVIARVVKIKGIVTAENNKTAAPAQGNSPKQQKVLTNKSKKRQLNLGAPIYTADHLSSQKNSHALLAFRDGSRMTLQEGTEFDISNYYYQQEKIPDQAFFNLVKGGLRALTGRIGKIRQNAYQINTPVATIGIRGTGFDLLCKGACEGGQAENKARQKITQGQTEGLYSSVWQGIISQTNSLGSFELTAPNSNYIANNIFKPQVLIQLPRYMHKTPAPRPDKVDVNENKLFGSKALQGTPSGVYVSVHDGHVILIDDETGALSTDLGKNEVGYISPDGEMIRVDRQQLFVLLDAYPLPSGFDEESAKRGIYSYINDNDDIKTAPADDCAY